MEELQNDRRRVDEKHDVQVFCGKADLPAVAQRVAAEQVSCKAVEHGELVDSAISLKAIQLPIHAKGHLCFAGDALMWFFFRIAHVFKRFHDDFQETRKHLPELLDYDWEYLVASHVKPKKITRERVEHFVRRYAFHGLRHFEKNISTSV